MCASVPGWRGYMFLVSLVAITRTAHANNDTTAGSAEDRLYQKFFSSPRHGRPVINASLPVYVNVSYQLHTIHQIDENSQTMSSRATISLEWFDKYISWNPNEFEGMAIMVASIDQLWKPKLSILNSVGTHSLYGPGHEKIAQVRANGQITWRVTDSFTTSCSLSLASFPFDQQRCQIILADEIYTHDQMAIRTNENTIDLHYYSENSEWILKDTSATKSTDSRNQADMLVISVTLRRRYLTAIVAVLIPVVCLAFLSLATFGTPNQNNEKTTIGMLTFVAYVIMLTIINDRVPLGSREVPIIAIYMATTCIIITLSVLFTNMVTKLHTYTPRARLPRKIRYMLFGRLAWCLGMRHIVPDKSSYKLDHKVRKGSSFVNTSMIVDSPQEKENVTTIRFELTQEGKIYNTLETILQELRVVTRRVHAVKDTEDSREEWMAAGRVLDRFCLMLFLVINIVCLLAMLIIYPAVH